MYQVIGNHKLMSNTVHDFFHQYRIVISIKLAQRFVTNFSRTSFLFGNQIFQFTVSNIVFYIPIGVLNCITSSNFTSDHTIVLPIHMKEFITITALFVLFVHFLPLMVKPSDTYVLLALPYNVIFKHIKVWR